MDNVLFVGPLDRVLVLRTQPMLEGLPPGQLAAVAQHARERHFARGAVLQAADRAAEAVHLIVSGAVEVARANDTPRVLEAGEAVGFVEMLSRMHSRREARAVAETVTLELDWDAQLAVCEEHFPVVMQYLAYLARRTIAAMRDGALGFGQARPPVRSRALENGMSLIDRLLVLSRSRVFSEGGWDALAELGRHVAEVRWRDGEAIWGISDPSEHFFLIVEGSAHCVGPDGEHFERRSGATLGMYTALSSGMRWHEATSVGATLALRIDLEPFLDILEDHFDLTLDFLGQLATRLVALEADGARA
jgi:signal-transduction protein with cAMP-binding, CBS, and nucleotidyltransferase domain